MAKKQKLPTKKVVIFIVEGHSDKTALEDIFTAIYRENRNVVFEFTDGDVTSDDQIDSKKAVEIIYGKVTDYMRKRKVTKNNIYQIVHLLDTDGAFIPDDCIIEGETNGLWYTPQHISCRKVEKAISRNTSKRMKMEYLLSLHDIKQIPYQCFFMSSNLDHALYNIQNLEDEKKGECAEAFSDRFVDCEKYFVDFLETDVVNGCPNDYPGSWKYIKEGLHSLERHTNLHIYFKENPVWL